MPKFLESVLSKEADKKGFTGDRKDHYVFGAMNNMGAMRGNKETPKGKAMQEKHERDTGESSTERESFMGRPRHKRQRQTFAGAA